MRRHRLSIGTKFGLVVALGTTLVLGLTGAIAYQRIKRQDDAQTREISGATTAHLRAAVKIVFDSAFEILDSTNDSLMTFKDEGLTNTEVYDTILRRMIDTNRYGAWIVWDAKDAPLKMDGGSPNAALSTYWHQNGMEMLRDVVPPEVMQSDLYRIPREKDRPFILEPHLIDAVAGDPTLVMSFSKPLDHDGRVVGVIALDIKLDAIIESLHDIQLPAGASMTVVSNSGIIALSSDDTRSGTPIQLAKHDLQRTFDKARQNDGSEIGIDGDGGSEVLTSWSRLSFGGVPEPWYLILKMRKQSLLAGTSNQRGFAYLVAALAVLAILALVFATMQRLVALPLQRLSAIIDGLGTGLFGYEIPETRRKDEVGDIARAVEHLQDSAVRIARLQEENSESAYENLVARRAEMDGISARFSQSIETTVAALDRAAATVEIRSREVSTRAGDTVRSLENMSVVSGAARESMTSVSTATSSLIETIGAIGDRTQQGEVASAKVEHLALSTDLSLSELKVTIGSIDKVATLISQVASQINLIALNATIEAARAGPTGLGFAVVAQEIKTLAMQTAQATEEISRQVSKVQRASGQTDTNVAEMSKAFDEKRLISSEIAGALDVQLGATGAIRGMIKEAMGGADGVAREVATLVASTHQVQEAATVMRSQSGLFNQEIAGLKREVAAFLAFLKAA